MQPRRRHSFRDREFEARNKVMECLACGSFDLPGEEFSDTWSVWDETALAELPAAHNE